MIVEVAARSPFPPQAAAFTRIGDDFSAADPGAAVTFNFDSSSTLATQRP